MWNTPLEKNRCFKFLSIRFNRHRCDVGSTERLMYFRPFSHVCVHVKYPLEKNRCFKFLPSLFDLTETDVLYICGLEIDVFSTVLPSLVFEKNAFMWNTPLEKNRCFKFLRSVFDSTERLMYFHRCDVYMRYETEQICIFSPTQVLVIPTVSNFCETPMWCIYTVSDRADWCKFDRSPITSFWEKCVHVKYSVGENRCFKFLPSHDSTDTDVMYICEKPNRLMYFRPFSHH